MTRRTVSRPLTPEIADAVYDVLVTHCGANERAREGFVASQTCDFLTEYRFCGSLGFGGKFWRNHSFRPDGTYGEHWYVSAYPEDRTDARDAAINAADPLLDALRVAHETEVPNA